MLNSLIPLYTCDLFARSKVRQETLLRHVYARHEQHGHPPHGLMNAPVPTDKPVPAERGFHATR